MKTRNFTFLLIPGALSIILLQGCAEKKTKIWIEPPTGAEAVEKNSQKLYYQVEDVQTGKKENLIIPLRQMPENLIVEGGKSSSTHETDYSDATKADQMISNGHLPITGKPETPTVSYLRGLSEVENLYRKNQYNEALIQLAPLIEQYPRQSRLWVMQGTLFRKIGEKKLAFDAYKHAREIDPNNPDLEEAVLQSQDELGGNL